MSFFFDVWSFEGFVLASDVRLLVNDQEDYAHKIATPSSRDSKVVCAIAVCGDYPKNCLRYFKLAHMSKDSLRGVAERFADDWTNFYAGTDHYSAVHLVGFEQIPNTDKRVPQVWYWHNWTVSKGFLSNQQLHKQLESFSDPTPVNNHIPWKINELFGKYPSPNLEEEYDLVMGFLRLNQPFFTWNGDNSFWFSAAHTIGSAINLLSRKKSDWTIEEISYLTELSLKFLARVGNLLPGSTVGLSASDELDLVSVTPDGSRWLKQANFP